jgi:AcrR family transcriptional regulator
LSSRPAGDRERIRLPGVKAPRPLLAPEIEKRLTPRQREVLDDLEKLVAAENFSELTMAEIAAETNCSLRTLYGIAPSKEELVLTVVDRRLHRIGRSAIGGLDAKMKPLDALRAYLRAANEAVQPESDTFSRSLADLPGAQRLLDSHEGYVVAITRSLLDRAIDEGDIGAVDTDAVAHVLGRLGREFARPEVAAKARAPAKATADAISDIILRGLPRGAHGKPAR